MSENEHFFHLHPALYTTVFKTLKGVLSFIIIWYNEMSTNPGFNISVDIKRM